MKEYNRTTKKWEEKEKQGSLKKRELCKGHRPHKFILILPKWVKRNHDLFKEEIERYYQLEEARDLINHEYDKKLNEIGVGHSWSSPFRARGRYYRCEVCGKENYE